LPLEISVSEPVEEVRMVSVAAVSNEGRRLTGAPWNTQQAPGNGVELFERSEPGPASLDLSDEDKVPLAIEGAEEPQEPLGTMDQSDDLVWDEEESAALRQVRKDAELTASADSIRAYLKQIGKVALLNAEEEVGDCCIEGRRRWACSSACAAAAVFVRSSRRDRRSLASGSRGR
jgi:hypothetical protein